MYNLGIDLFRFTLVKSITMIFRPSYYQPTVHSGPLGLTRPNSILSLSLCFFVLLSTLHRRHAKRSRHFLRHRIGTKRHKFWTNIYGYNFSSEKERKKTNFPCRFIFDDTFVSVSSDQVRMKFSSNRDRVKRDGLGKCCLHKQLDNTGHSSSQQQVSSSLRLCFIL